MRWQERAEAIAEYIGGQRLEASATAPGGHFWDPEHGGWWFSDTSRDELGAMTGIRRKIGADSPLASGNAAAAMLMLELGRPEPCRRALEVFSGQIVDHAGNTSALLEAAIRYVAAHGPFTVPAGAAVLDGPAAEAQQAVDVTAARWLAPDRLALTLTIAEPFHLYAEDAEHAQAVALTSPHPAFTRTEAPPATAGQYRGEVTFTLHFSQPVSGGAVEVSLRYQACDESRCLMPVTKGFELRPAGEGVRSESEE